jgi:hypothetical protein
MNQRVASMGIAIFLMSILPAGLRAQLEHADLKEGKRTIHNVLILPAQASITKSGMKGNEALVEESRGVESALASFVGESLASRGCNVLPDAFTPAILEKNPDLKYALADLQTRYDNLQTQIGKKPKDIRTGRFTLGDDVANFSPSASSDALVFVRAFGVVTTGGKKVFGALTGTGGASSYVVVNISVVDAQTGVVLYFAYPTALGDFVGNPDHMKKAIDKSFKDFENPRDRKK